MQTFNSIVQIKAARNEQLTKVLDKLSYKLYAIAFYKIRNHVLKQTFQACAEKHNKERLFKKAFNAIQGYQARKAKEDNDYRIARKFRFVSLLQLGLKTIFCYKDWRQRKERNTRVSSDFYRHSLIKKAWDPLCGLDQESLDKIKRASSHYKRHFKDVFLAHCFIEIHKYSVRVQENRRNSAIAMLHHDNRLVKKVMLGYFIYLKK